MAESTIRIELASWSIYGMQGTVFLGVHLVVEIADVHAHLSNRSHVRGVAVPRVDVAERHGTPAGSDAHRKRCSVSDVEAAGVARLEVCLARRAVAGVVQYIRELRCVPWVYDARCGAQHRLACAAAEPRHGRCTGSRAGRAPVRPLQDLASAGRPPRARPS